MYYRFAINNDILYALPCLKNDHIGMHYAQIMSQKKS